MKAVLSLLCLMPMVCLASPFDEFTGKYISDSTPRISNENNARCFRYAFDSLESVRIEKTASTNSEYKQTHNIFFNSTVNESPISISHPVMEYRENVGMGGVDYAQTTGGPGFAENTIGTKSNFYSKTHTIKIKRLEKGISLEMIESVSTPHGNFSCEYQMDFI